MLRGAGAAGAAGIAAVVGVGAASGVAAAPTRPAADNRANAGNRAGAGHSADVAGAPLVVYLRDAASGEFDVFAGTSRAIIVDPDLAARLTRAVR
jgi:hypothetical protein